MGLSDLAANVDSPPQGPLGHLAEEEIISCPTDRP